MPWNQPGAGGPDEQDPWGQFDGRRGPRRGARGGGRGQRGDGPPDLDEIFREA
ncbi:MAG: protease modulator HflK N-terminal domain-containing protein, partial [Gammaproteobacteria bacterium]|nr:protease modulator HflK N-terminal domain-containing protein [Gammaproteobacteria bacterium]